MTYKEAANIAVKICYQLQMHCDKINIAGSIRRKKPEVKDIEIVCLPKKAEAEDGLFDKKLVVLPSFIRMANILGTVEKGSADGKYMKIVLPEGINLDLFMPSDYDYYRQYAIRTGSASYAQKIIAGGWRKIGWCGSDVGLRKIEDCENRKKNDDDKDVWVCINPNGELPPVWQSEQEFFDWIKVKWIEPNLRDTL